MALQFVFDATSEMFHHINIVRYNNSSTTVVLFKDETQKEATVV